MEHHVSQASRASPNMESAAACAYRISGLCMRRDNLQTHIRALAPSAYCKRLSTMQGNSVPVKCPESSEARPTCPPKVCRLVLAAHVCKSAWSNNSTTDAHQDVAVSSIAFGFLYRAVEVQLPHRGPRSSRDASFFRPELDPGTYGT